MSIENEFQELIQELLDAVEQVPHPMANGIHDDFNERYEIIVTDHLLGDLT